MKKWLHGCAIVLLLALVSCPAGDDPETGNSNEPMTNSTAIDYFRDKDIRRPQNEECAALVEAMINVVR